MAKTIGTAIQDGNNVKVYDERGSMLFMRGSCKLVGFTSTTVSLQYGHEIRVYDANGTLQFSRHV